MTAADQARLAIPRGAWPCVSGVPPGAQPKNDPRGNGARDYLQRRTLRIGAANLGAPPRIGAHHATGREDRVIVLRAAPSSRRRNSGGSPLTGWTRRRRHRRADIGRLTQRSPTAVAVG